MSLAENLLNSLSTENISENYSTNEEEHIVIDNTRKITVPQKLKTIAVEQDKDIETVTFDCIRYWDGHDLCNFAIYINYVLPNLTTGTYTPSSVYVDANDSRVIHFNWNIKDYMTQVSGGIVFAVSAIKTNSEGNIEYRWSSLQNSDFFVAEGIDISEPPNDIETSTILAQMSEILNQLQQETRQLNKVLSVTSSTGYIELDTANNTLTLPIGFRIFYSKEDGKIVSFELAGSSVTLDLISPNDTNISLLLYSPTTGYQIVKYWELDEFDLASTYYVCTISAVSANGVVNIPQINIGVPYKVDGVIYGGASTGAESRFTDDQVDALIELLDNIYDGSVNIEGSITFTIDDVEYQAEEGMTWGEWCDSEYNTDGFWISAEYQDTLVSSDFISVIDNEGNSLHKDALIIENGVYTT